MSIFQDPSVNITDSDNITLKKIAYWSEQAAGGGGGGSDASASNQLLQITEAEETNTTLTTISGKLPATLGQKAMAASLAVTIASNQSAVTVAPAFASSGHFGVNTEAVGTDWASLASQACKQVTLVNDTGVDLVVRQGGAGASITVWDRATFTFFGITNTNVLSIQRKDTANTPVFATFRWEA